MPRTLLVGSFAAALLAWNWLRLEERTSGWQTTFVVVLALVPALVSGARRRAVAAGIAFLVAAASAFELPLAWSFPGRLLARFGGGFLGFYDVQVPFNPAAHPRMHGVLLIAVFAFTLSVAAAAAERRPGLASAGLVVGVGWPATLLPGHDFLRGGMVLVGVLGSLVILRSGPLRGLGAALAAAALVLVAAVAASSSPAFAKQAFLDWQHWDPYTQSAKPVDVSYVWDSSYDGLTFHGKPRTVLRIAAGPTSQYWRATVLNTVELGRWFEEPPALQDLTPDVLGEPGLIPDGQTNGDRWQKQTVTVEALRDKHLVGGSVPVHFDTGAIGPVRYDPTGIVEANDALPRGARYNVWSYSPSPTPAQLARSKPIYSSATISYREVEPGVYPKLFGKPGRAAQLSFFFNQSTHAEELRPYRRLYAWAEEVAGGAKSPYAAAVALERWFRLGGGFLYDQHPPRAAGVPPLVDFVTRTRSGYCQHFAGAMALMLRYLGIPSRVAAGFTSGVYSKRSKQWLVSDRDAHAWVEVWFRGWGWLPFDPTPGRSGLAGQYSASSSSFDVAATAAVLRGSQGMRKFGGLADQLGFGGGARVSPDLRNLTAAPPGVAGASHSRAWGLLRLLAVALIGLALLVIAAKFLVRRSRYLTRDPRRLAAAARKELRDILLDQQVDVPPSATLRELAELVESEFGVGAAAFGLHADAARFGPVAGAREAARATRRDLSRLRRALRRELTRFERVRGLLSLRSLGLAG